MCPRDPVVTLPETQAGQSYRVMVAPGGYLRVVSPPGGVPQDHVDDVLEPGSEATYRCVPRRNPDGTVRLAWARP